MDDESNLAGPADLDEQRELDWLEILGTALLGIAAVSIAFATFQAHLWGGVQDTRNTASALHIVDAADELGLGDSTSSLDQLLFVDLIRADEADADLLFGQMSEPGQDAWNEWVDWLDTGQATSSDDPLQPFDSDTYWLAIYGTGTAQRESAFALFDAASDANTSGDNFTLAATIVALVLFLAGVSLVLKEKKTRVVLLGGSAVILAGTLVTVVFFLPWAWNAASDQDIQRDAYEKALAALPGTIFEPVVGESAFVVYLGSPEVTAPSDTVEHDFADVFDLGYGLYNDDINCDLGAAQALGLDGGAYFPAKVYLPTRDDAAWFVAEYDDDYRVSDIVEVEVRC